MDTKSIFTEKFTNTFRKTIWLQNRQNIRAIACRNKMDGKNSMTKIYA